MTPKKIRKAPLNLKTVSAIKDIQLTLSISNTLYLELLSISN